MTPSKTPTINLSSVKKAWALLDQQEQRNAFKVLAAMIIAAFSSAAMVGSVFPFLSVLANPMLVQEMPALSRLYNAGGFTSIYSFLVALGLAIIVVIIFSNLLLILNAWAVTRFASMRTHSISRRLLAHYLGQPYVFFLGRHSGDLATKILTESQLVVQQFLQPLASLVSASLTIAAVVITVIIVDPLVGTVMIGSFTGIYGGIMFVTRRYIRRLGQRRARANEARFRIAGDALGGIKDIKLLGREATYLDRYDAPSADMARSQIGVGVISEAPRYAIQVLAFGGVIVLCLWLLDPTALQERNALEGFLPIVGLMAFAGQRLMPEWGKLYMSATQMTAGSAAVDRVYDDLCRGAADGGLYRSRPPPLRLRRILELEGVSYTYPNADRAGLTDVTLSIRAGERIGVVGRSGAGKTTFADVVLGLLPPDGGTIRADGIAVTKDNIRAWQQTVGYVPQNIFLTDASLSENIALGLPPENIDSLKVERSARIAQLHELALSELTEGYATPIGEKGIRLSGGQRQRIGIARALYHDADLIVFDEATSALDNLTERDLMVAIDALPGDKTLIIIAHRLSTVRFCDRILVMEGGSVSGFAPWSELIHSNSSFRALAGEE